MIAKDNDLYARDQRHTVRGFCEGHAGAALKHIPLAITNIIKNSQLRQDIVSVLCCYEPYERCE